MYKTLSIYRNVVQTSLKCCSNVMKMQFHRFNRQDLVFCKKVKDLRPNTPFSVKTMWCWRVIQLFHFNFSLRSLTSLWPAIVLMTTTLNQTSKGKLPVVRVGDCGRIPHNMQGHALMRNKNFNGKCDEVDSSGRVSPTGSPLYYINKYAMAWSNETADWISIFWQSFNDVFMMFW